MTGKLIKYEFRSMIKQIGIVWLALPAVAVIFSLSNWAISQMHIIPDGMSIFGDIILLITTFLYGGIFMALAAVTCLIVLMRFYKGLLRDEGYLMHTLPVKTWQLITAKGVVAACVVLGRIFVAIISILLLNVVGGIGDIGQIIKGFFGVYGEHPIAILYTVEILLIVLAAILKSIYQVYAAMSIGQLAQKHRIAFSVLAYIGIGIVMSILFVIGVSILGSGFMEEPLNRFFLSLQNMQPEKGIQLIAVGLFLSQAVQVVLFHVVSERILCKHLNLE